MISHDSQTDVPESVKDSQSQATALQIDHDIVIDDSNISNSSSTCICKQLTPLPDDLPFEGII